MAKMALKCRGTQVAQGGFDELGLIVEQITHARGVWRLSHLRFAGTGQAKGKRWLAT